MPRATRPRHGNARQHHPLRREVPLAAPPQPSPPERGGSAARAGPAPEVQLAWARDRDGRKVHVAALDPKRRRDRAPFACLGCGDPLIPHLGEQRARHFAHEPGSRCPLTAPETALHLNVKERLLWLCGEAFAGRLRVVLGARCPGCRREAAVELAAAGDGAVAEGLVGSHRADVLVTRAGAPALALEVLVTHAVDAAKEAALGRLAVPALEVDAHEAWEEERDGATYVVVARSLGVARCGRCQLGDRAEAGRGQGGEEAELAELEAYRARGLFGSPPGPTVPEPPPLAAPDGAAFARRFECRRCGGRGLAVSPRIARHGCPGAAPRPVAWRGYDGALVELKWWK
ncbi:competence protein CoiA family protein [Anaeromyxobacter paludicola]|uniref:Competence protein CoiA-like N-terminal domain-containing protein n=1 Tax=Anaeromyxobacter paludicola TaxID=2918171 RepID=A0ABM7XC69_9BACT|nr:competence protein CoiA family protein [Anaeromyxobacter paludicola]BDG09464.1 hypothetical protein AMPC_25770 [Anaeromyxobacter paludicola]